ncbi:MAG: hypothetical protein ACTSRA_23240 [Promethearchaeota archaeon]
MLDRIVEFCKKYDVEIEDLIRLLKNVRRSIISSSKKVKNKDYLRREIRKLLKNKRISNEEKSTLIEFFNIFHDLV